MRPRTYRQTQRRLIKERDMTITRKAFLGAAAGSTVVLLLQACGGGDDDNSAAAPAPAPAPGPGPGPGAAQCGATGAAIAGNHGHALTIPAADLDSATDKTYNIVGTANHSHLVTFTPTQLQALKAGQGVTVLSTTDASHEHAVTATCA
jgi:hypothetical protein